MMAISKIVLDADILLYSRRRQSTDPKCIYSAKLIDAISKGTFEGVVPIPVLLEVFYKIQSRAGRTVALGVLQNLMTKVYNLSFCDFNNGHVVPSGDLYVTMNFVNQAESLAKKNWKDCISAVDSMVLGVCKCIPNSIVCTYDGSMHIRWKYDRTKQELGKDR